MEARIAMNLEGVQRRIAEAAARAGRDPGRVKLVCITKAAGLPDIQELYRLGMRAFGENRVDTAAPKIAAMPPDIRWHFIAPVQRRKTREVVAHFHTVDAVDRLEAARALHQRGEEAERVLDVLVEVNVSGEASKHGFSADALPAALREMKQMDRLRVNGLMTMAPFDASPEIIRTIFRKTRQLAGEHDLQEVSMGMSGDFEIAVEEGATQVRIGSSLFE